MIIGETPKRHVASPRARKYIREHHYDIIKVEKKVIGTGPGRRIIERDVINYMSDRSSHEPMDTKGTKARVKMTPLAMKYVQKYNLDLQAYSDPSRRLYVKDVSELMLTDYSSSDKLTELVPMSNMRRAIARSMSESVRTRPHVTLHTEVDMTHVMATREKSNPKPSLTDIFVLLVAKLLNNHPALNSTFTEKGILLRRSVHIGVAVALDEGLIVPVVQDANQKSLDEIHGELDRLIKSARSHRLKQHEIQGGTFTISNLGMFDIDQFNPIINDDQAAVLGIGRTKDKVIADDGAIRIASVLSLSLSFDHRIVDGAPAAAFLTQLKAYVEMWNGNQLGGT